MNDVPSSDALAGASPLLWAMAALVAVLAAQVAFGYARHSARQTQPRSRALTLAVAAATLGTGLWSAMLLGISSQALAYPLGYAALTLVVAWVAAVLPAAAALAWLVRRPGPAPVLGSGVLIGAGALATELTLVRAAGLVPGVAWAVPWIALAGALVAGGSAAGLWITYLAGGRGGARRRGWRWGAALLVGGAVVAGQEVVMSAAAMPAQLASGHAGQVPASAACVLAGVGVPMLLLTMLLDLRLRSGLRDPGALPARPARRSRSRRA
jgi:NO-binding membrane sensor protein with MHYT domain